MESPRPSLSVVLVTDRFETIRAVVECLRRQTIHEGLELVIAAPSRAALGAADGDLQGFAAVQVVEVGSVDRFDAPRAAAIRAAQAPIVFVGETHTLAHPGFAEALLRAHAAGWAVVVPGLGNANPDNALSWAIFLLDYGRSFHRLPGGEVNYAPTHNASFRREVLLDLGPALGPSLSHGEDLTAVLRERGHRTYREPSARLDHINVSRLRPWIGERFIHGLLIAGRRNQRWSWFTRLVYFFGSPLIPVVLVFRQRETVQLARKDARLPLGTIPALIVGAVVSSIGEMIGYAIGAAWSAESRMTPYEMHKVRYISRPARLPFEPEAVRGS
jgi:hypothetical protein